MEMEKSRDSAAICLGCPVFKESEQMVYPAGVEAHGIHWWCCPSSWKCEGKIIYDNLNREWFWCFHPMCCNHTKMSLWITDRRSCPLPGIWVHCSDVTQHFQIFRAFSRKEPNYFKEIWLDWIWWNSSKWHTLFLVLWGFGCLADGNKIGSSHARGRCLMRVRARSFCLFFACGKSIYSNDSNSNLMPSLMLLLPSLCYIMSMVLKNDVACWIPSVLVHSTSV